MAYDHSSIELKQKEKTEQDPFTFLRCLSEEMRRLFKWLPLLGKDTDLASPRIQVVQHPNELIFRADLPGSQKEDLKVQIDDRLLIIQGQPKEREENQDNGLGETCFCRCLELPEGVNSHDAHATFREGVLEVTLPLED